MTNAPNFGLIHAHNKSDKAWSITIKWDDETRPVNVYVHWIIKVK